MPSVRYAPTSSFINHISGTRLERVRFIVIDDDLSAAFCPTNLAAVFGDSDRVRGYQAPQPQPEEERSARVNSKMASDILTSGNICANIEQKISYLQDSFGIDKEGGQEQNEEQKRGSDFFADLHSCYHHTQVSNIRKFVCWSHGPTYGYIPQITLLFKELEGTFIATKFDWQGSPHASVFMCNNNGGVEKLAFGDATVSGLEFVSLGEPIGNIASYSDVSSFISLIPGSDRADQIFDTLMDKTARKAQRPQGDVSLSSAVLSSSQSDDGFLMMKSAFPRSRQGCLNTIRVDVRGSIGKQLVKTKTSCHIGNAFRIGLDNQPSRILLHPGGPHHRALNWLPSKISTQMATRTGSKAMAVLPSKNMKHVVEVENKGISLVATISTGSEGKRIADPPNLRPDESNRFKKGCERLPRLSRTHPTSTVIQETNKPIGINSLGINVTMNISGNTISGGLHDRSLAGKTYVCDGNDNVDTPQDVKELVGRMYSQQPISDASLVNSDTRFNVAKGKDVNATELKQVLGSHKKPFSCPDPHASNDLSLDMRHSNTAYVLGEKVPTFSPDIRTAKSNLCTPDSAPCSIKAFGNKNPVVSPEFHPSKFDLRGLPRTCVPPALPKQALHQAAPPTPPHIPGYEIFKSDDPVFNSCIIRRGFNPIYPSKETPKTEFENRTGGLQNWYRWPPVQVAREYLPQGMKETDWSWTDNDVSGEFIPGGVAW